MDLAALLGTAVKHEVEQDESMVPAKPVGQRQQMVVPAAASLARNVSNISGASGGWPWHALSFAWERESRHRIAGAMSMKRNELILKKLIGAHV
jgi:hypothetical protein